MSGGLARGGRSLVYPLDRRPVGSSREEDSEETFRGIQDPDRVSEALALLEMYVLSGARSHHGVLEIARLHGPESLREAEAAVAAVVEAAGAGAIMVTATGVPGKLSAGAVRSYANRYGKVLIAVDPSGRPFQEVATMWRASLPDVAGKIEVYDASQGIPAALKTAAGKSGHLRAGAALDVMANGATDGIRSALYNGQIGLDLSTVRMIPGRLPDDDQQAILGAVQRQDVQALKRLLDPHVFSDPSRLAAFGLAGGPGIQNEVGMLASPQNMGATSRSGGGMYHSSSSSWSQGKLALLNPKKNVPDDDEYEDNILDQDVRGGALGELPPVDGLHDYDGAGDRARDDGPRAGSDPSRKPVPGVRSRRRRP